MSAKNTPKAGRKVHAESDRHHTLSHFHIATVWFAQDDNVRNATLLAWLSVVATASVRSVNIEAIA
jgi:hypothetical protein